MTASPTHRPLVALVGRTNVGKSTLWNRLTETSHALVSDEPHTTRDRKYGTVLWRGMAFDIIDTGGMDVEKTDVGTSIHEQALNAIRDADLVLFVGDAHAGIQMDDRRILKRIRPHTQSLRLVINKVDKPTHMALAHEQGWYALRCGDPIPISATTHVGIGELLDTIVGALSELNHPTVPLEHPPALRLAIIGRPNVGKSSLLNAILGEKRAIVSAVPHTTREPQDTQFQYKNKRFVLVDTAGIRAKRRAMTDIEELALERNMHAMESADVAALVFDVTGDPTAQDRHLAGLVSESHCGLVIVANKWDLVPNKQTGTAKVTEALIRQLLPFLDWAPLVFVSARNGLRAGAILDHALAIQEERERVITYNALNRLLKQCIQTKRPLTSYGPSSPRIYDIAQVASSPPTFLMTVIGEKQNIHPSWLKFFERRLREHFGFHGTPVVIRVQILPKAKSQRARNLRGPGMDEVAGPIKTPKPLVNQTRRRQKYRA